MSSLEPGDARSGVALFGAGIGLTVRSLKPDPPEIDRPDRLAKIESRNT